MKTKTCTSCKKKLPLSAFGKHNITKDGLRGRCQSCRQNYSASKHSKSLRAYKYALNQIYVYDILQHSVCIDCGDDRWQVLEFDHVKGAKKYNISRMYKLSLARIQKEIAKCEIRCANCHRMKTMRQFDCPRNDFAKLLQIKPVAKRKGGNSGEAHPNSKLTVKKVKAIRYKYSCGVPQNVLVRQYGISKSAINNIVHNKLWKNA